MGATDVNVLLDGLSLIPTFQNQSRVVSPLPYKIGTSLVIHASIGSFLNNSLFFSFDPPKSFSLLPTMAPPVQELKLMFLQESQTFGSSVFLLGASSQFNFLFQTTHVRFPRDSVVLELGSCSMSLPLLGQEVT
jgi:hypothetical protein